MTQCWLLQVEMAAVWSSGLTCGIEGLGFCSGVGRSAATSGLGRDQMVMSLRESELHSKTVSGSENVGELLKYNRVEIESHAVLEEKCALAY